MRAELLLHSGEKYAQGSVEFRLLRLFAESRDVYRMAMDTWTGNRLLEVAALLYAKFSGNDVGEFDKGVREERSPILDLIDPYVALRAAERAEQERQRKQSDAQKRAFMDSLGDKPFASMEALIEAVTGQKGTLIAADKNRKMP